MNNTFLMPASPSKKSLKCVRIGIPIIILGQNSPNGIKQF